MPNLSFDVFFDTDFLNFTATRSDGAPRIKPDWKVRTAPKLAPKDPPPTPDRSRPRPPSIPGPRITELPEKKKNIPKLAPKPKPKALPKTPSVPNGVSKSATSSVAGDAPRKNIPKLAPKSKANSVANGVPNGVQRPANPAKK